MSKELDDYAKKLYDSCSVGNAANDADDWVTLTTSDNVWWNNTPERRENMRYLYEVILVNPKNDSYYDTKVIARSETSALMLAYNGSPFNCETGDVALCQSIPFDDLKTSCRVLMEWKKCV